MKALILIDIQNDFMPGGALAVSQGDEIIPFVNDAIQSDYDLVVATQDWHPLSHKSFASNHKDKKIYDIIDLHGIKQVLWPNHCVQGTSGADLHPQLQTEKIEAIFRKGTNLEIDSYSAFFDNNRKNSTGLHGYLQEKGIKSLTFCGLAGDFCVAYSVNDALSLGYEVRLLQAAIRSISMQTYAEYVKTWKSKGVQFI